MAPVGILYALDRSPPCRAVMITAQRLGIALDIKPVDLFGGALMAPDFLQMNPQHTIPIYKDNDGTALGDSHAIMAFLVDKYAKDDTLYSKNLGTRALINQRLHFDSGNVFALHLNIVMPMWKRKNEKNGATMKDRESGEKAFDILNRFLEGNQWVAGTKCETIADFSLATSMQALNVVLPFDPAKNPNIQPWLNRCEALRDFKDFAYAQEGYKQILESMLKDDYSFLAKLEVYNNLRK